MNKRMQEWGLEDFLAKYEESNEDVYVGLREKMSFDELYMHIAGLITTENCNIGFKAMDVLIEIAYTRLAPERLSSRIFKAAETLITDGRISEIFYTSEPSKITDLRLASMRHYIVNPISTKERKHIILRGQYIASVGRKAGLSMLHHLGADKHTFVLKNFLIQADDCRIIQSALHPKLIMISFKNCYFDSNGENGAMLNLKDLPDLQRLEFINCVFQDMITTLESVTSHELEHIELKDSLIDPKYQKRLMNFLLRNKRLHTLEVSMKETSPELCSKITGDILKLPLLKKLDASNNADIGSFAAELERLDGSLPDLQHLDLSSNVWSAENIQLFSKNLKKIPYLRHLGIEYSTDDVMLLATNILDKANLIEIISQKNCNSLLMALGSIAPFPLSRFSVIITPDGRYLAIYQTFNQKKKPCLVTDYHNLPYFENVEVDNIDLSGIASLEDHLNFCLTLNLTIHPHVFYNNSEEDIESFIWRFDSLKVLNIDVYDKECLDYMEPFFRTGELKKLQLTFTEGFNAFEQAFSAIVKYKVDYLTLILSENTRMNDYWENRDKFREEWKTVLGLELRTPSVELAVACLRRGRMTRLQELTMHVGSFDPFEFTLYTHSLVKKLQITVAKPSEVQGQGIERFLKFVPRLSTLHLYLYEFNLSAIDFKQWVPDLRELVIYYDHGDISEEFLMELAQLPSLNKLVLQRLEFDRRNSGMHRNVDFNRIVSDDHSRVRIGPHSKFNTLLLSVVTCDNHVCRKWFH